MVDNVTRFGRVFAPAAEDAQTQAVRGTRWALIRGWTPRPIHTVGTKDWDGFVVALVR